MNVIGRSNVCCNVRCEENGVYSKCVLLDNQWEVEAGIFVDNRTFIIKEATWEVHRGPENVQIGFQKINQLQGKSGYIEGKRELNVLLPRTDGEMIKYMFNQCINGLVQAETYIYKIRGFASEAEYDLYWDQLEENGCRMYSNKSEEDLKWTQYAAPLIRNKNLFNRFKNSKIVYYGGKYMMAYGSFNDSYHEFDVSIEFNVNTGIISDCEIVFCRAPGKACFTNNSHRKKLIGRNFNELNKKDVIHLFGKSEGCYHLVEMVMDLLRLIKYI